MHKIRIVILLSALVATWFVPGTAGAQQQIVISGGKVQLSEDQKLMLEAASQMMKRDFKGAESMYSQAIAINGSNLDAYLQRGLARRELGDATGMASDARTAIAMANAALNANPHDPNLYYKRGMALRLLKNYDQAEKDVLTGIRLGGPPNWQSDLQAIELEKKEQ